MVKLLSGFIAKQLAKNLGKHVKAATLTKFAPGIRAPGGISAGTNPTPTSYTARGWVDAYSTTDIDGSLITKQDRKISLLGASIQAGAVPADGDTITIQDLDKATKTFRILGVPAADPDGAVYECQGRQ